MKDQMTTDKMDKQIREALPGPVIFQAPAGFTDGVMEKIEKEPTTNVVHYSPLISKRGWFIISSVAFILLLISYFSAPAASGKVPQILQRFSDLGISGDQLLIFTQKFLHSILSSQIYLSIIVAFGLAGLSFLVQQYLTVIHR